MSGPRDPLRSQRVPLGAARGVGETHEGTDGSETRSPLGTLPPDAILLAQAGGTLPASTAPKISTPLPAGARRRRNGSYHLRIGIVDVTILPDTRSTRAKLRNRARTNLSLSWTTPSYSFAGAEVTDFKPPTVNAKIQTTYGPGASPSDRSGYGKGKTLRDHEGHHGTDYLAFIRANPPAFTGEVGMTVAQFRAAVKAFNDSLVDYVKRADAESEKETDCTGVKASFCK